MRFVIVTGMSGSGKSTALKMLEDAGYFCVDNMPISLIDKFAELSANTEGEARRIAVGVDTRSGEELKKLPEVFEKLDIAGIKYEILFLETSDDILVQRYKETRRAHPLGAASPIEESIGRERKQLEFLKKHSDYIIDTSNLLVKDLKKEIEKIFVRGKKFKNLYITILSFGFKYGIPAESDIVFDVRFMPNPYYVESLRYKTGNDSVIRDFVMNSDVSEEFLKKLFDMIGFLIPNCIEEGKTSLVISIGCTGGKHRSVTVANALYEFLDTADAQYGLKIKHRDIDRDIPGNRTM